ncbi:phosphopantetheine-binding protein, partial [Chitinophaga oryziterrae]
EELLGATRISIHDNFFELGGDSIITIQVVSRVRRHGYDLQVVDLFEHQSVASLSACILARGTSNMLRGEQGLLTGESGLLPIQQQYFASCPEEVSHFNQSLLLGIDKSFLGPSLEHAFTFLREHHDALRFTYEQINGRWIQHYGTSPKIQLYELNLSGSTDFTTSLLCHAEEYQSS